MYLIIKEDIEDTEHIYVKMYETELNVVFYFPKLLEFIIEETILFEVIIVTYIISRESHYNLEQLTYEYVNNGKIYQ